MKKLITRMRIAFIAAFSLISLFVSAQTAIPVSPVTAAENKVAILPMVYVGDGNDIRMDEMRYRLQSIAYDYLRKEAFELKYQDPAETNALLLKKGINETNFRQFTPRELASLLEVEYVITGMVVQENGSVTTSNTGGSDWRTTVRPNNRRNQVRTHENNWGTSRTTQQINTTVDLGVYNDKGEKIYSRARKSLLTNSDTYKDGLHYLLKRMPLYRR